MRYHLCDTEQSVTGISIELAIQSEPFAESVPYELTLHAAGAAVAHVPAAALTPAELFALGPCAPRRGRGRVRPLRARG